MGENYKPHAPAAESATVWCRDENGNWCLTSLTNWLSHPLLLAFLSLPYNFFSMRVFFLSFLYFSLVLWGLSCSFCPDFSILLTSLCYIYIVVFPPPVVLNFFSMLLLNEITASGISIDAVDEKMPTAQGAGLQPLKL